MQSITLSSIGREIVDEVVISAMALLVEDAVCTVSSKAPDKSDDITIAIYCDHHQQSAVVLRCSYQFAKNLTSKMLEMEPDAVAADDVLDATGELVNVIAGNLRGLVSSPGPMTTPFVLEQNAWATFREGVVNTYSVIGEGMQVLRM